MEVSMRRAACVGVFALVVLIAVPAYAQLNGANVLGDNGVGAGTQPPPGWNVGALYYRYATDTVLRADGSRIVFDPNQPGNMTMQAIAPMIVFVSRAKILGGDYGMTLAPSFANGSLEAPVFGFQQHVGTGWGDLYFLPITLGWHTRHADFKTAFGFFAPTGRYTAGALDNIGKGMWSYELSAGTTVFLDSRKAWSVATGAFWETHSNKSTDVRIGDRITLTDVSVGQILTLEGGLGRSFLQGAASVGVAYYAQWKLTADHFATPIDLPLESPIGKHRVYAVGPDVTLPIVIKRRLISLVNVRYFWETGARVKTQGQSLVITAMFPVPSPKVQ
jgi:hypothetical protein